MPPAYIPPHLRNAQSGLLPSQGRSGLAALAEAHSTGPQREALYAPPPRSQSRCDRGSRHRERRNHDGPCAVRPTQMTLHRPCACTLGELPQGASLLGTAEEFCDSFFHVRETPEAPLPLCCLRHPGECEGRNTVIVARVDDGEAEKPLLIARFHNKNKDYHAERVMMEDAQLLASLRGMPLQDSNSSATAVNKADGTNHEPHGATGRRRLLVYISLQPCHHSSSMKEISCTRDLFAFHQRELLPRQITFELVVAYPYRSHWEAGAHALLVAVFQEESELYPSP